MALGLKTVIAYGCFQLKNCLLYNKHANDTFRRSYKDCH